VPGQRAEHQGGHLVARPRQPPPRPLAARLQPGVMPVKLRDELVHPLAGGADRRDDRRLPRARGQGHRLPQVAQCGLGVGTVRLVHHEHVGDLEHARLRRLDGVAHARHHKHDGAVGRRRDLHLGLSDPDSLHQDHLVAGRGEHPDRLRCRRGEPAELPAAAHRPDEHPVVGGVLLHPHPVAEQRAAGERGRRVDGEHRDPAALALLINARAERAHQRAGDGGLPRARRAGQADHAGAGPRRLQVPQHRTCACVTVLHPRDHPGERALIARLDRGGDIACAQDAPAQGRSLRPAAAAPSPARRRRTARPRRARRPGAATRT